MSFWSTPIRLSEAKCILRQRRCGFGSRGRSSLRLAVSKSSMRPENRSTRKTRTQIAPVVRFFRFHCRGSDREPTRWPGGWRQSMRMSRKAILAFRFSSKDDTDSRSHALVVKVYWLSCDKTRRLQSPLLKTRGLKPKSSSSLTSFNTAIGAGTLLANTADGNTVTGIGALFSNTTGPSNRSEEHTSELQSHSFISYAVFCLKK